MEKVVPEVEELPKAMVRRVVKEALSQVSPDADFNIHKGSLLAFCESARIFIHYLSATANDICKESKRQTINAEDVLKALEEIEFPEFVAPLRSSLAEFKKKNAGKRAAASSQAREAKKKKKSEEETPSKKGGSKPQQPEEEEEDADNGNDASEDDGNDE
ncbi:DNA polymerase II subunit B4 [Linum grandiflorum]